MARVRVWPQGENRMYAAILMFISLTHPHAQLVENALVFKSEANCKMFTAAVVKDPSLMKDNVKIPPESEYTIPAGCVHLKSAGE
jgi:hypothetical protein